MIKRYSLQLGAGIMVVVFLIAMLVSVYGLNFSVLHMGILANKDLEILATAKDIQFEDLTLTDAVRGIIIDPTDQKELDRYNEFAGKIDTSIKRMKQLDPTSIKTFNEIDKINVRLIELETEMINKAPVAKTEAINIYKGEYTDLRDQLQTIMVQFVDGKKKAIVEDAKGDAQHSTITRNYAVGIGVVAIVICIVTAFALLRSVVNPVKQLAAEATRIADGDLTADDIAVKTKNEVGQLAVAFNTMLQNLKVIARQLNEKSQVVASSAAQLTASAENVSAGATETATTINEVASTVERVAASSQNISDASSQAATFAKEGSDGLEEVVSQMDVIQRDVAGAGEVLRNLRDATGKITQIVELITQIADQTNLLALNAAIEAARAGEHGKGFAVVADEVRKLAEQSADAAQEIQQMIAGIQNESQSVLNAVEHNISQVDAGVQTVDQVKVTFEKIIGAVQGLTGEIQQVAAASEQMSSVVQNVAAAAEEQTATMEEVSSTIQDLARMAEELEVLASRFRLS